MERINLHTFYKLLVCGKDLFFVSHIRADIGPDGSDHAEAQPGLSRQDPHLVRGRRRQEAGRSLHVGSRTVEGGAVAPNHLNR